MRTDGDGKFLFCVAANRCVLCEERAALRKTQLKKRGGNLDCPDMYGRICVYVQVVALLFYCTKLKKKAAACVYPTFITKKHVPASFFLFLKARVSPKPKKEKQRGGGRLQIGMPKGHAPKATHACAVYIAF